MEDELGGEFETVVLGTGMTESILAAAAARVGRQVLHMDRNDHYGSAWATFNFDSIFKWIDQISESLASKHNSKVLDPTLLKENEVFVDCQDHVQHITNIKSYCYVPDDIPEVEAIESESKESIASTSTNDSSDAPAEASTASADQPGPSDTEQPISVGPASPRNRPKKWTLNEMKNLWRKYNLDLAPKVLFSRGSLVDLLISSNIARYAEFKAVTRVLTYLNNKLEQVPCSRADVFSTKEVTIVEKRMLMKLLTFCSDYQRHPEEYQGYEGKTFLEYLKSRKLTSNIVHYVTHAIAMTEETTPLIQGLEATQQFLQSLGRYGNTPFLWPLYGSGELPQCFCRLCAVFGGVYYLKRDVEAYVVNTDTNKCEAIVSNGKRISCQQVVLNYTFAPKAWLPDGSTSRKVSRGMFLTNRSVAHSSEKAQVTLLRMPPVTGSPNPVPVTVIELGPGSMAAPPGMFVVHMTCPLQVSAEQDLQHTVKALFKQGDEPVRKPRVLWCVYWEHYDSTRINMNTLVPNNVVVTSSTGDQLDFDHSVLEARQGYERLFPDAEFLPRAPDPEEIILDDGEGNSNPGDGFHRPYLAPTVEAVESTDSGDAVIPPQEPVQGPHFPNLASVELPNEGGEDPQSQDGDTDQER